jgi:hypothetical protein
MMKVGANIAHNGSLGVAYRYENKTVNQPMAVI